VSTEDFRTILGVRFFAGPAEQAVDLGLRGGLVVVPSAPLMVTLVDDENTRAALLGSDLALTDSGLMVLLWNFLCRDHVRRVSGLEYLDLMLRRPELSQPGVTFWIMPNEPAMQRCRGWLTRRGYPVRDDSFYLAPFYGNGPLHDVELIGLLDRLKPRQIFMGVGGGVQERLGLFLRRNLGYRPGIHCIGAAIGFLTGDQVRIPMWADAWKLGWFFRCMSAPRRFIPRYWKALRLFPILAKYRERLPVEF
jgi:UDP-N-acetyl-D-mannosaminuronic acid transferase (WecB/TagA/CpsF family)